MINKSLKQNGIENGSCKRNAEKSLKENDSAILSKDMIEKPLSIAELANLLGVSRQTIHKWKKSGIISGYKLSRRVYFFYSEVKEKMKLYDMSSLSTIRKYIME